MADAAALAAVPHVAALDAALRARYPFFKGVVARGLEAFGPAWADEFEQTLARLLPGADALGTAVDGYAAFVMDLLRRQRRFERELTYPAKAYAEAAAEVYLDADYMAAEYLPGLLLSHFLWPHHHRHRRFFESAFAAPLARAPQAAFVEVGVGTGLYTRRLLELAPAARGLAVDISPASCAFTTAHLAAFGLAGRSEVRLQDVVTEPLAPTDWLICVEVLEHLEDPLAFLRVLRAALAPGGRAFVTAALNAAHVDHLHLYRTPEEVGDQLEAAGFFVEQALLAPAHAPRAPGVPVPAVVAFVVG